MVQQFSSSVISEGVGGVWSSSNDRVVNINATTGIAMATAAGTATIYFMIPERYSAQTEVKVESLSYIHVATDDALVITNIPRQDGRGYIIPVIFGHDYLSQEHTSKASGLGDGILLFEELGVESRSIPFQCVLSFAYDLFGDFNSDDLFEVKSGFINGKPMCYVIPRSATADVVRSASSSTAQLSLAVRVFDEIQGRRISSEASPVPFVPAFVLSETELELSADRQKAQIVVLGITRQLDSLEVRSQDSSLVAVTVLSISGDNQAQYEVEVVGKNPKSFKKVWVEFKSQLTGQRALLYVSYTAPFGGAIPVVLAGAGSSSEQCPKLPAGPADRSFQGFFLGLLGQTSAWIIGLSFFIGFIILALILCCSPRQRSVGPHGGAPTPGSRSQSPYGLTPVQGSPYGQAPYHGSTGGSYYSARGTYLSSATGAYSPGAGTRGGHAGGDDPSVRSFPEEHDETRREVFTTYRHTKTSSRTYLSGEASQASGGLSIGRISPNKSPRLFSVNQ